MKILHLGNPYFHQDFKALGHDVIWAAHAPGADLVLPGTVMSRHALLAQLPPQWFPDLVLLGDDSIQPKIVGLESLPVPLVWYAIDSHLHARWHRSYAAVFDVILVAQKNWLPIYRADGDRQVVAWGPLFCNVSEDRVLGLERTVPLTFVGTMNAAWNPRRVELVARIQARYPLTVQSGAYCEPFNRSMMVLNQSVADDINFRTFQAMACGALLLTERVDNGFDELFIDRTHCVVYGRDCAEQAVELAEYYQAHAAERECIARQGYEAVMAAHTSRHRAEFILHLLSTRPLHDWIGRRCARQLSIQSHLASVYEISARKYQHAAKPTEAAAVNPQLAAVAEQYRFLADTIREQLGQTAAA